MLPIAVALDHLRILRWLAIYTYHDPIGADAGRNDFQTQGIAYSSGQGQNLGEQIIQIIPCWITLGSGTFGIRK